MLGEQVYISCALKMPKSCRFDTLNELFPNAVTYFRPRRLEGGPEPPNANNASNLFYNTLLQPSHLPDHKRQWSSLTLPLGFQGRGTSKA